MSPRNAPPKPSPFLTTRVHLPKASPPLIGACAGYELGTWRATQLADHMMEWLPEFALAPSEWAALQHANAVQLIRRAAQVVYSTKKFQKRGEFGELLLHVLVRQIYDSTPAISKLFYKTAPNDTVKGFDAVHVVGTLDDLELWLGEAKFFKDINRAIAAAAAEIEDHLNFDYLRGEFMLIAGKLDKASPHYPALDRLLSTNTSLDEIFARVCIPILLTYDSACLGRHNRCGKTFEQEFDSEVRSHHKAFAKLISAKKLPPDVRLHLFLLPLSDKKTLIAKLDEKLKTWQRI